HRRTQPDAAHRPRRHPLRRELHRALPRAEVAALCAAAALVAAGCGAKHAASPAQPIATGPPNVVRVALTNFRWPLAPALAAVRACRSGQLDEAPVALGDIVAGQGDPALRSELRARRRVGVDLVLFRGVDRELRRAYWQTADGTDYGQRVPEQDRASAFSLV